MNRKAWIRGSNCHCEHLNRLDRVVVDHLVSTAIWTSHWRDYAILSSSARWFRRWRANFIDTIIFGNKQSFISAKSGSSPFTWPIDTKSLFGRHIAKSVITLTVIIDNTLTVDMLRITHVYEIHFAVIHLSYLVPLVYNSKYSTIRFKQNSFTNTSTNQVARYSTKSRQSKIRRL